MAATSTESVKRLLVVIDTMSRPAAGSDPDPTSPFLTRCVDESMLAPTGDVGVPLAGGFADVGAGWPLECQDVRSSI